MATPEEVASDSCVCTAHSALFVRADLVLVASLVHVHVQCGEFCLST